MSRKITYKEWTEYTTKLFRINSTAANMMWDWLRNHSMDDVDEMIEYAYQLATKYGEASAALAAEMYDVTAELAGHFVPAAIPANTATYEEVAEAVLGTTKMGNPKIVADSLARLVKMSGVDTTMQNALRDGAWWAWVPVGDTCAFCITLASRGWQPASKKAIKGGHATHIHANCDCTYAISFDGKGNVEGYDEDYYMSLYDPGRSKRKEGEKNPPPNVLINDLRRRLYAENRNEIRQQQREAYHDREARKKNSK